MKINKHTLLIFLFLTLIVDFSYSQTFARFNDWKKYRKEIIVQIGASQFLGDLGGLNKIGTHYSPADLEFSLTRPAISVAYRYKFFRNFNSHTSFNYLNVAGNDKLTKDIYRNNRNLNFKSNIFELATRLELSFFKSKGRNRYGLNKMHRSSISNSELIGFVGIGVFYFNPKGLNPANGSWVALRPLHTEGQGLPNGPKQYKRTSFSIPMGIAYRMVVNRIWSVGLEVNYRKTFTDYIDDVSTVYYNKYDLGQAYGPLAVQMADPSLGNIYGATSPDAAGNGAQRGDIQKDSYASFQVTVGYFIKNKRKRSRLRSKF